MIPIKAYSVGDAHKQVVEKILRNGNLVVTQDGEVTLELLDAVIEIATPIADPMVHSGSNFQKGKLKEYVDGLLFGTKGEFTYDYHTRLFHWGDGVVDVNDLRERELEIDQINRIIEYLRDEKNQDSRRAVAITWYPWKDLGYSGPCLQYVQIIVRNGKVHMTVLFRSNDMLSALGANMFALVNMQVMIATQLGLSIGGYTHHSVSAHVYVLRDQHELENMFIAEFNRPREAVRLWLQNERPDISWKV